MCVLFVSMRQLERAENIRAVYDAYDGEKQFTQKRVNESIKDLLDTGRYRLLVTDELMNESPGKCIFIGHGAGAGKTYGFDQPRPYFSRSDLITYAIASSKEMVPHVARQLRLAQSQVIPIGFPRTDSYFKKPPERKGLPFWLYAPTFRNWPLKVNFNEIRRHIPDGHRLIFKPHMTQPNLLPKSIWKGIETASAMAPSADYLMQMDALVTDYSSIMFDAMVLRKPYVLFSNDKNAYMVTRGMYYLYPGDYGPYFCDNEADLIPMLETAQWNDACEQSREFYVGACDGKSVERAINLIRSCL